MSTNALREDFTLDARFVARDTAPTPLTPGDRHAADIYAQLAGKAIPKVTGWNVMLAIFKRPEKTSGGIILTERTRDEDEYQGRVGLVVAIGSQAYTGKQFGEDAAPWVKVGDWAIFPNFENASTKFKYNGQVVFCSVPDDRIIATVADPMDVY